MTENRRRADGPLGPKPVWLQKLSHDEVQLLSYVEPPRELAHDVNNEPIDGP